MTTPLDAPTVTVLWAGERRQARIIKRFKNGKVRVQIHRTRWVGGRPGSLGGEVAVTVEPWQIVDKGRAV
jgi:hypothetical protein